MRRHDEHGAALIIVTIALVLISVIAALVIDLGNVRQQKQQAQNVADAAALSASLNYSDTSTGSQSVWAQGFNSAFKTLNLTPPGSGWGACPAQITAGGGSGVKCYAATVSGRTVYVATPWNGNTNWVHVATCWSAPAYFGKVIGLHDYSLCAKATAQYSGPSGGGGGGPPQSGCSSNDLSITGPTPVGLYNPNPTTAQSQLLTGTQLSKGTVLSARYSDANGVALDPSTVVFLAPGAGGVTVQVTPTITGSGASGSTYISYTLPATLASVTASLFVVNAQGTNCGQVVWSSCDFNEEDFFTSTGKTGGTPTVIPEPGYTVSSSATLGATYYDETQMNPAAATLFLNQGRVPINFSPAVPCDSYVSGCPTDIGVPSPAVSVIDGTSQSVNNNPKNVTPICKDGYANKGGGIVNIQLCDYMGDPIAGRTVQLLSKGDGPVTPSPNTAVTGPDGVAAFTFSSGATTTFTARDVTDNITFTQTISVTTNGTKALVSPSFQLAGAQTDASGGTWGTNPGGKGDTKFAVGMTYPLSGTTSLAVGWNSAFIYTMDTDQNKAGGDCAWAVWSFTSTSGTGRATSLPTLVQ